MSDESESNAKLKEKDVPYNYSEKGEISQRMDNCLADFVMRNSAAVGLGVLFNFLLYRKPFRGWPISLALGLASGYSISKCQNSLRSIQTSPRYVETPTAEEIEIP